MGLNPTVRRSVCKDVYQQVVDETIDSADAVSGVPRQGDVNCHISSRRDWNVSRESLRSGKVSLSWAVNRFGVPLTAVSDLMGVVGY